MKQPSNNQQQRRQYVKPSVTAVREDDLLAMLGPAQGYGRASMPLDSEWSR